MKIDIPVRTVLKLEQLLKFMALAHIEMGKKETNEYHKLLFNTQESGDTNSDPLEFDNIDRSIFELSDEIRKELRFI